jgi:chromosome segregation ATPase
MLELVEDPRKDCLLRRLDDLRARFETAAAIFGEATRELEDDLDNTRSRVAERDALAAQLAGERDVLAAQLAVERSAVARFGDERGALSAERDALSAERDALSAERDALSAERDKFAVQLSAAKSEGGFLLAGC